MTLAPVNVGLGSSVFKDLLKKQPFGRSEDIAYLDSLIGKSHCLSLSLVLSAGCSVVHWWVCLSISAGESPDPSVCLDRALTPTCTFPPLRLSASGPCLAHCEGLIHDKSGQGTGGGSSFGSSLASTGEAQLAPTHARTHASQTLIYELLTHSTTASNDDVILWLAACGQRSRLFFET